MCGFVESYLRVSTSFIYLSHLIFCLSLSLACVSWWVWVVYLIRVKSYYYIHRLSFDTCSVYRPNDGLSFTCSASFQPTQLSWDNGDGERMNLKGFHWFASKYPVLIKIGRWEKWRLHNIHTSIWKWVFGIHICIIYCPHPSLPLLTELSIHQKSFNQKSIHHMIHFGPKVKCAESYSHLIRSMIHSISIFPHSERGLRVPWPMKFEQFSIKINVRPIFRRHSPLWLKSNVIDKHYIHHSHLNECERNAKWWNCFLKIEMCSICTENCARRHIFMASEK